jgi:hypothetical protein
VLPAFVVPADRTDAANDVFAGLQIYLRLKQMGADRKIPLDLDAHSGVVGNSSHISRPNGASSGTAINGASVDSANSHLVRLAPGIHKYPPPRQLNALAAFKSGTDIKPFAEEAGIKTATVEGDLCDALAVLVDDTLNKEEMARLVPQIKDVRVRRKFKILLARMRRSVGEEDVNSDATMLVSDSEEEDGDIPVRGGWEATREAEVDLVKNQLDDLGRDLSAIGITSEVELEWQGDDMLDGEHGWTREELEAAMRLRDSDRDYDVKS